MKNANHYFKYLDQFVPEPAWTQLHGEICHGIAVSQWHKRFVSSGVAEKYQHREITPYMMNVDDNLDESALKYFKSLTDTDQRIKFLNAYGPIPHPFWVIYLRNNRRIERTGILNKSVGADCEWTHDSQHFPKLVEFIKSMPFDEIGRVIIFMTEANNSTLPHFDDIKRHVRPSDDFIWFTTKPNSKKIFVYNEITDEKFYPDWDKKFIWFDEMNYHGTDPVDHFSFSVRIDGVFRDDIKKSLNQ